MKSETNDRLAERTALVTGAGSPVGRALCERFAREGAWVVAVDGDETAAESAAQVARAAGTPAIGLKTAALDPAITGTIVATALQRMWQIDVVVNNTTPITGTPSHPGVDWGATMAVNVEASYRFAWSVVSHMRARRTGAIVSVAWLWGGGSGDDAEAMARETSEGAIGRLTGRLADTYGDDGIRTYALCPTAGVRGLEAAVAGAASGRAIDVDALAPPARAAEWIATLAAGSVRAAPAA